MTRKAEFQSGSTVNVISSEKIKIRAGKFFPKSCVINIMYFYVLRNLKLKWYELGDRPNPVRLDIKAERLQGNGMSNAVHLRKLF
jgi:hypothetical protein